MTDADISRALVGIADELAARYAGGDAPLLVGVHTRGVDVAKRLKALLHERGCEVGFGTLDISLYRDDLDNLGTMPSLKGSDLPQHVEGLDVVLVDDVLFTGRTVKAAIDGITDFGRPRRIELAVLVDRGNRELPIQADYVGESFATQREDYVAVHLEESDGEEGVFLLKRS
ncbi:bifunctional pyr operon transcriptional regulator/uracil phosphoribosyltransferase PyrR [Sulfuriroseicoccus oceanibius]|uniref:Bifunctional protein PyrR n=1 Tax=Sulfuriroseicoccus oceanibius TaxID=2707525 RepID=A0A7T7JBV5_9BACT|nr:bifunctional pyr operon transcriptional regulator/uracil phosphoribosyltransferase PyrR [Sulfuriroseicoccus oceanibius]QQL44648.1 bifunctional pyr operon transcriptional regulator/uracil phosphoribosyltransferase PyrR [Sulfuriroseicoccus oceanibius]